MSAITQAGEEGYHSTTVEAENTALRARNTALEVENETLKSILKRTDKVANNALNDKELLTQELQQERLNTTKGSSRIEKEGKLQSQLITNLGKKIQKLDNKQLVTGALVAGSAMFIGAAAVTSITVAIEITVVAVAVLAVGYFCLKSLKK